MTSPGSYAGGGPSPLSPSASSNGLSFIPTFIPGRNNSGDSGLASSSFKSDTPLSPLAVPFNSSSLPHEMMVNVATSPRLQRFPSGGERTSSGKGWDDGSHFPTIGKLRSLADDEYLSERRIDEQLRFHVTDWECSEWVLQVMMTIFLSAFFALYHPFFRIPIHHNYPIFVSPQDTRYNSRAYFLMTSHQLDQTIKGALDGNQHIYIFKQGILYIPPLALSLNL